MISSKRLLSMNLALLMVLSLAVPAMAEDGGGLTDVPQIVETHPEAETSCVEPAETIIPEETGATVEEETETPPETAVSERPPAVGETPGMVEGSEGPPEAMVELEGEMELEGIRPALWIDQKEVTPGESGEGWSYVAKGELELSDFSGATIHYTDGDLVITNYGVSTLDARFRSGSVLSVNGDLTIFNIGPDSELNVYAWSTSFDLSSYGLQAQNITIENQGTMRVQAGCEDEAGLPQCAAIHAENELSIEDLGLTVAYGGPALYAQSVSWDKEKLIMSASDHVQSDAPRVDEYRGERFIKLEPILTSLRLHGCGGTWKIGGKQVGDDEVPVYAGSGLYLDRFDAPQRNGYDFLGWTTAEDYRQGTWYSRESFIQIPDGEGGMDLYAQWEHREGTYRALFQGWDHAFPDGREACAIGFDPGETITIPDLDVAELTLLGWTETRSQTQEDTKWYFVGDEVQLSGNVDLYPHWVGEDSGYGVYYGCGGVSNTGHEVIYQISNVSALDLHLYGSGAFTRSDAMPFGGWNEMEDWSGKTYGAGQIVEPDFLREKHTFYAMWGEETETKFAKWKEYCYYTGAPVEMPAESVVRFGTAEAVRYPVEYVFYPSETSQTKLSRTPTDVGTYWVEAHYPGDREAGWLPSTSELRIKLEIRRGTAVVTFPDVPTLRGLWMGEDQPCQLLDQPTATLNGVPADLPKTLGYYPEGDPYGRKDGLPNAVGRYVLYGNIETTDNYYGEHSRQLPLVVSHFIADQGKVMGNVDLTVEAPQAGTATAVAALYDRDTGRMRAVTTRAVQLSAGTSTVRLRDLEFSAYDAAGDTVKIFLLDSLNGLKPLSSQLATYFVS